MAQSRTVLVSSDQDSAMPLSSCVIDIGSPEKGKLGWAFAGPSGLVETGSDLDAVIDKIATKLSVEGCALGIEAPMFIPYRNDAMRLTRARAGEGSRPWSAAAGCGALTTGIAVTTYTLGKLRSKVPKALAILDWRKFDPLPHHLLLFEAFVSGKDKADTHLADSTAALRRFISYVEPRAIESDLSEDGPVQSLLGAALLRTGWSEDLGLLAQPCLVLRPVTMTGVAP